MDAEGNIVFTNKKAESLLGYSRKELLSMNIRQLYAEEILDQVEEGFSQLKQKGEKTILESILKDRDGNRIPVLKSDHLASMTIITIFYGPFRY